MTLARQALEGVIIALRATVLWVEDTTFCLRQLGLVTLIHPWCNLRRDMLLAMRTVLQRVDCNFHPDVRTHITHASIALRIECPFAAECLPSRLVYLLLGGHQETLREGNF